MPHPPISPPFAEDSSSDEGSDDEAEEAEAEEEEGDGSGDDEDGEEGGEGGEGGNRKRKRRRRLRKQGGGSGSDSDGSDDSSGGEGGGGAGSKRQKRLDELQAERRATARRRWKAYYGGVHYGYPASFVMYELAEQVRGAKGGVGGGERFELVCEVRCVGHFPHSRVLLRT